MILKAENLSRSLYDLPKKRMLPLTLSKTCCNLVPQYQISDYVQNSLAFENDKKVSPLQVEVQGRMRVMLVYPLRIFLHYLWTPRYLRKFLFTVFVERYQRGLDVNPKSRHAITLHESQSCSITYSDR